MPLNYSNNIYRDLSSRFLNICDSGIHNITGGIGRSKFFHVGKEKRVALSSIPVMRHILCSAEFILRHEVINKKTSDEEETMRRQENRCPNLNHSRTNVTVHFCPMCGEVVNINIPIKNCTQDEHAKSRRDRNKYCVDCGEQLIK